MVDWQRVCLNIRGSGLPLSTAAKQIGSDWQHLNRLARGEVAEPRFRTGLRLLDLHLERCPHKHTLEHLQRDH